MNRKAQWLQACTLATLLVAGVLSSAVADSARLGIAVRPENRVLSSKMKERYQVDGGVLVDYIQPDSPADQADIRVGDLIISFQGHKMADWDALMAALKSSDPGAEAMVGLIRGDKSMEVKVVLASRGTGGQQEQATGKEVAQQQKRTPFTLRTFLMSLAASNAPQGQQPAGDQGQGLTGNSDAANQNTQADQDYAAAAERARLQRAEEERQEQERQRQEELRQQEFRRQQELLEQERERAQQRYLQALQFQHEQDMLRLQWTYRQPCPPVAVPPRYYYVPSTGPYSRGSSGSGLTLPQIWHGVLGVGGALLGAGADTIGALIGK